MLNYKVESPVLKFYRPCVQEDEQLLSSRGLTACRRLAVQQRAAEKRLLAAALDYTEQRLHPWKQLSSQINRQHQTAPLLTSQSSGRENLAIHTGHNLSKQGSLAMYFKYNLEFLSGCHYFHLLFLVFVQSLKLIIKNQLLLSWRCKIQVLISAVNCVEGI